MKAIQLTEYGNPQDVLQFVELPDPGAPGADEILVRVNYSPINNSDLLTAHGYYPLLPASLPAVIGGEGVGTVEQVGSGITHIKPGDKVSLPTGPIAWAEFIKAPAKDFFVLPDAIDLKQAALLTINPITAVLLLSEIVKLEKDDWVVLNGANSAVGRCIIAVAKSRGIKTVAIIRRKELIKELQEAGADVVLVESNTTPQEIAKAVNDTHIKLALDVVGGESTNTLAKSVGTYGDIIIYGQVGGQGISVNVIDLVFRGLNVHGFWLYYPQYIDKHQAAKAEAAQLIFTRKIHIPVLNIFQPADIKEALEQVARGGKVLLEFSK